MGKHGERMTSALTACMAAVAILFATMLAAQEIAKSALYRQSAIVSTIFSQDSVGIQGFLTDGESITVLQKFLGAVTDAYINFELIPHNEANTFVTVYESLNREIAIDRFEYHRKDLVIYGDAVTRTGYESFVQSLRETGYFDSVTGHAYLSTDDSIRFEVECASASQAIYLDFANG